MRLRRACPYCAGKRVLPGFNDFESLHPELMPEWDYERNEELPSEIFAKGNSERWWICKLSHSYTASTKNRVLRGQGCQYCAGRKLLKGFNDLFTRAAS